MAYGVPNLTNIHLSQVTHYERGQAGRQAGDGKNNLGATVATYARGIHESFGTPPTTMVAALAV